jgi:hypothetical protein
MWPDDGTVFIADATWQDEPQLAPDDEWAGTWASSLIDPLQPPFPGVRVRCAAVTRESSRAVTVECWVGNGLPDLTEVFSTTIRVGSHGVTIEDAASTTRLRLPAGSWPLSVRVGAEKPEENYRVAFCFPSLRTTRWSRVARRSRHPRL